MPSHSQPHLPPSIRWNGSLSLARNRTLIALPQTENICAVGHEMKILFASMSARLGMCFTNCVPFTFFLHNVTTFAFAFANRRCLFLAFQDKKRAAAADAAPRDGDKALHCRAKRRRVSTDVGSVVLDNPPPVHIQALLGMGRRRRLALGIQSKYLATNPTLESVRSVLIRALKIRGSDI